jgi:RNA polymerase sigma factor (sigma-70 family)
MKSENYDDYIEIDLVELFYAIISRWTIILLTTVVLATLGYCYGRFVVTPVYSSNSALYVLSKSTSITSMADIQVGANLTNDYMVVIKGRPVLEQVIENLGLDMDYDALKNKVSVTNESNTRILNISVRDHDIKLAKVIADEIANVSSSFISEKMDQDPPTILQYGYTDTKRVNRSPNSYAVIFAFLGLIASAGIVVLLYLINDKIMTPEDLEKLDSFDGKCKLTVWLCQIAKNTYISMCRKDKHLAPEADTDLLPEKGCIEEHFCDRETAFAIHRILHTLEEPYKEVFSLRTFGELSFRQIAELFGKTESWARVTYHRARLKIKEELK